MNLFRVQTAYNLVHDAIRLKSRPKNVYETLIKLFTLQVLNKCKENQRKINKKASLRLLKRSVEFF